LSLSARPVSHDQRDNEGTEIAELWDDELYRNMPKALDGSSASDKREASFEKVRRILDYEAPSVQMVDHSFKDAVRAFERINTLGVKLKREDIESANIAARHSGFIADQVAPFLDPEHGSCQTLLDRILPIPSFSRALFLRRLLGR
jgi:hypothetical protein